MLRILPGGWPVGSFDQRASVVRRRRFCFGGSPPRNEVPVIPISGQDTGVIPAHGRHVLLKSPRGIHVVLPDADAAEVVHGVASAVIRGVDTRCRIPPETAVAETSGL